MTDPQLRAAISRLIKGHMLGMSESDDPLALLSLTRPATQLTVLALDYALRKKRKLVATRKLTRSDITVETGAALHDLLVGKAAIRASELTAALKPDANPANQSGALDTARVVVFFLSLLQLFEEHTSKPRIYWSNRENTAGVDTGIFLVGDRPSKSSVGVLAYLVQT